MVGAGHGDTAVHPRDDDRGENEKNGEIRHDSSTISGLLLSKQPEVHRVVHPVPAQKLTLSRFLSSIPGVIFEMMNERNERFLPTTKYQGT